MTARRKHPARRKKKAARKTTRTPKPSRRCSCAKCRALKTPSRLVVEPLGEIVEIVYVHADDGKRYRHTFKGKRPGLYIVNLGRSLVVHAVKITRVSGQHFIGD